MESPGSDITNDHLLEETHNMMTNENKNEKRMDAISVDDAIDAMAFRSMSGTTFTT
jgi:hypothetical protein